MPLMSTVGAQPTPPAALGTTACYGAGEGLPGLVVPRKDEAESVSKMHVQAFRFLMPGVS